MTPEYAADQAAAILDQAAKVRLDPERIAALVQIADGWTRLHAALARAPKAARWPSWMREWDNPQDAEYDKPAPSVPTIVNSIHVVDDPVKVAKTIADRLRRTAKPSEPEDADSAPQDATLRERAADWITGFHAASDDDRINCVALLLDATEAAYACAKERHKTRADLLSLGWLPPAGEEDEDDRDAYVRMLAKRWPRLASYGFPWALDELRAGAKVTRDGWLPYGQYLTLEGGVLTWHVRDHEMPGRDMVSSVWHPDRADLLADDWLAASSDGVLRWPDGTVA